jgi:hypothetical protein
VTDLSGVIIPVVVATLLSVSAAWATSHWSSPAQQAYVAALEKRLSVVMAERDDHASHLAKLEARIVALEQRVAELIEEGIAKDRELARLYRRLDADEARLIHDERQLRNEP